MDDDEDKDDDDDELARLFSKTFCTEAIDDSAAGDE
jgi:hypothetical protein